MPRSSTSSTKARKTLRGECRAGRAGRGSGGQTFHSREQQRRTGRWVAPLAPGAHCTSEGSLCSFIGSGEADGQGAGSPGEQLPAGTGQHRALGLHHARHGRHHTGRQQLLHPSPHETRLVLGKEAADQRDLSRSGRGKGEPFSRHMLMGMTTKGKRTSLAVWWLRSHLPMQGTQVQSLVWEDPTCCRKLSPCAATTEPELWSRCSAIREATAARSLHTATRE